MGGAFAKPPATPEERLAIARKRLIKATWQCNAAALEKVVKELKVDGVDVASVLNEKADETCVPKGDHLRALERLTYPRNNDESLSAIGGPKLGCGQWQYPLPKFRHNYAKVCARS